MLLAIQQLSAKLELFWNCRVNSEIWSIRLEWMANSTGVKTVYSSMINKSALCVSDQLQDVSFIRVLLGVLFLVSLNWHCYAVSILIGSCVNRAYYLSCVN